MLFVIKTKIFCQKLLELKIGFNPIYFYTFQCISSMSVPGKGIGGVRPLAFKKCVLGVQVQDSGCAVSCVWIFLGDLCLHTTLGPPPPPKADPMYKFLRCPCLKVCLQSKNPNKFYAFCLVTSNKKYIKQANAKLQAFSNLF